MASCRQTSLARTRWESRIKHTRRVGLLDQTDPVVPWTMGSVSS